jgi:hypothetical protein
MLVEEGFMGKGSRRSDKGRGTAHVVSATKKSGSGVFTWVAVGLVVSLVAVVVIIKATGGGTSGAVAVGLGSPITPVVSSELTGVPASVFNTVGVTGGVGSISVPSATKNQPLLQMDGKPEILYVGAEFCPYCGAQRWPLIIALSRFGTWSGLTTMESSTHPGESYPGTATFSFEHARYNSAYFSFASVEEYTRNWDAQKGFYTPLQKITKKQSTVFKKYDNSTYVKGLPASSAGSIPFLSFANQYVGAGSSYSPAVLANLSRGGIAAGLSDATSPVTATIIVSANYETAILCRLSKGLPGNVCSSAGVRSAAAKL